MIPDDENANGQAFQRLMTTWQLAAIDTVRADCVQSTYFGLSAEQGYMESRINYQILPEVRLEARVSARVVYEAAQRLQLIPDTRLRDHAPLEACYTIALDYTTDTSIAAPRWNKDALMLAISKGNTAGNLLPVEGKR